MEDLTAQLDKLEADQREIGVLLDDVIRETRETRERLEALKESD